jgi:hypothetical protein
MSRARTITGAGVVCKINGVALARVSDLSFSVATSRKPAQGIDSFLPQELIQTAVKITGQLKLYRTLGDGGAEGAGILAQLPDLSREKYFSIQLVERSSDTVVFEAWYCSCTNQSWDAPARGTITGTLGFEALDYKNELAVS